MDSNPINYYSIFGVSPQADKDTIKSAFVEKARLLVEAYQVLTDEQAREQYDLGLKFQAQPVETAPTDSNLPQVAETQPQVMDSSEQALRKLVVSLDGRTMVPGQKITKRLLSRIPVDKEIVVHLSDKSQIEGKLKDISGSGARIVVRTDLQPGNVVEISMSRTEMPFVLAQVVRVVRPGQEFGVKWLQIFEGHLPKGIFSNSVF